MGNQELLKSIKEAKTASKERKFVESIELAINLKDVDLSDPKNRINEEILLPKGRGKPIRVAVIGSNELKSKTGDNADSIYGAEDITEFADDKKNFKKVASSLDFIVAEAPLMPTIGKSLGQVLGPRGKMPRPIPPGQDPTPMIANLRRTVRVRSRDKKTFHVPIGTKDMDDKDLAENITTVVKRVVSRLEKGNSNIRSIYVKTSMGKAVKIDAGDIE